MGVSRIGILNKEVKTMQVLEFVKQIADSELDIKVDIAISNISEYIDFKYKGESSHISIYLEGHDYQEFTNYSDAVTCLSSQNQEIMKKIVQHFGGWYIPNDCADSDLEDSVFFYEFTDFSKNIDPVDIKLNELLKDETNDKGMELCID